MLVAGGEESLSGVLTKGAVVCTGSQEACATSVFARCWRQEFYFNEFFTFDCSSRLLPESSTYPKLHCSEIKGAK